MPAHVPRAATRRNASRRLRVLVLTHADLLPPRGARAPRPGAPPVAWVTERDVLDTLAAAGHSVRIAGLDRDLAPLTEALDGFRPQAVLMLLEEFCDRTSLAANVVGLLEARGTAVTGCTARGLVLAHDKAVAKALLEAAGVPVAPGTVVRGRTARVTPPAAPPPWVVKSASAHGSAGLTRASLVRTRSALGRQVRRLRRALRTDVLVEAYVEGRELYVGLLPGPRPGQPPRVLPPMELARASPAGGAPWLVTERAKWDPAYQRRHGLAYGPATRLSAAVRRRVDAVARACGVALELDGPARVDLRLRPDGQPVVIEVNPNPDLCATGEYVLAAGRAGLGHAALLARLLEHARARARAAGRGPAARA